MRLAWFLSLLVLLAIQEPVEGNVCDDIWTSLVTFNLKMDRQVNIIENQAKIIEKQAKTIENLEKVIENQTKGIEELKVELSKTQLSNAAIETQLKKHSADLQTHDSRLKSNIESDARDSQLLKSIYGAELGPRDCDDIRVMDYAKNGVYTVFPGSDDIRIEAKVFCEFGNNTDNWLVFQRRKDGSVDFERNWSEYERGFGDLNGEFWLGNDALSLLTTHRKYKLRVELEDFSGQKRYAEYSTFSVRPALEKYRLTLAGYSGNAGDSLNRQNGMKFSTKELDNDAWPTNCAITFRGAWWYKDCHDSNLNGRYLRGTHTTFADGVDWRDWHGYHYSLKTTEMKITRVA